MALIILNNPITKLLVLGSTEQPLKNSSAIKDLTRELKERLGILKKLNLEISFA